MAPAIATYTPRDPSQTVLYHVIAEHLETFLASLADDPEAKGLPAYVQREFYDYLRCGILAHGFLRLGCDTCHHELLVPFSCKRRGFCPSCAGRRMAQMAAHLVEQVIPWVPTRQWVVSVPIPLRYWTASSPGPDRQSPYHHPQDHRAVLRQPGGHTRCLAGEGVMPGSVTFIQRFGSALQLESPLPLLFLEGCLLDRTDEGRKPRFLAGEPPTDTDIAAVVQKISRRVIRTLRRLGYLETGMEAPVATGYDPLRDTAPEFARTMAASVQQRIAFGERAGQHVRRIGAGFGSEGEAPTAHGSSLRQCQRVFPPRQHPDSGASAGSIGTAHPLYGPWGRVAGAPPGRRQRRSRLHLHPSLGRWHHGHSPLAGGTPGEAGRPRAPAARASRALWGLPRAAQPPTWGNHPTPRQQGVDEPEAAHVGTPCWSWARLLQRVFGLELATCPWCQHGTLRLIAVITQGEVIRKILAPSQTRCRPTPHCAGP